jgi:hypothetical protein
MNKVFFVFAFLILLPAILASSVLASNIGYIIKTPASLNTDETAIKNILVSNGHKVTILDDDSVINPNLYDVIIVGEDVSDISELFNNKAHKTIFLGSTAARSAGLGKYSGTTSGDKIFIMDNTHDITNDFPTGERAVYSDYANMGYLYGCLALNSKSLAYKTYDSKSSLLVLDKNALLLDSSRDCSKRNQKLAERNIFFGMPNSGEWNQNAKTLFINSVNWILLGSDRDSDGFYSDNDCNDNNPNINPNAIEIKYNGIDENCDGYDLADVDKDGYCKQGYAISNKSLQCPKETQSTGTDCNDNDATINLGVIDVYKNCKNDAPIIDAISSITIKEGETAEIVVFAQDPEGSFVSYSINDSRFEQDYNTFSWETSYYDAGVHIVRVSAGDGELAGNYDVKITVTENNQPPYCSSIPQVRWDEDGSAALNLNDYCNDNDGDSIFYYFYNSSAYDYISLNSLENGVAVFSSKKDWNGEDWIVFKVSDKKNDFITNKITLKVTPVGDAPVFIGEISDINLDEDTNLVNYLNLNNYFKDIDSSKLNFGVSGNHNVNINITNGIASFYPAKDWFGEENVIFSAWDESNVPIYSNAVTLTVKDMNEPPEFGQISCNTSILEDTQESCKLTATDPENNAFTFSIVSENNLDCSINLDNLGYISKKDYNGPASCLIRVSDNYGYSEYLFQATVLPVNDAPILSSYDPLSSNIKTLEMRERLFKVVAKDVDSVLSIKWFLNGEKKAEGDSYKFILPAGNYELTAEINDGEYNLSHAWSILAQASSSFTCAETGGHFCNKNEMCQENDLISVLDSASGECCLAACVHKFEDLERCKSINGNISIDVKNPDSGDDFEIGSTISVDIDVENNGEKDFDFDVTAYLYDITDDDEIDDITDSLSVDGTDTETIKFELDVPQDLDEDNDYAIFVKAEDGSNCNEEYIPISIKRKSHDMVINLLDISPLDAYCGDLLHINTRVKNEGTKNENAYLVLENKVLNIYEKSEEFKIEKYGEDDEYKSSFDVKIPDNAQTGKYEIKAQLVYGSETSSLLKEITVNCKNVEAQEQNMQTEPVKLEGTPQQAIVEGHTNNVIILIAALVVIDLIILLMLKFIFG